MIKTFEAFISAKKSGHLRSMRVTEYGSVSVDSDVLMRSTKVADNVRNLQQVIKKNIEQSEK
jgi:hypothetical protein